MDDAKFDFFNVLRVLPLFCLSKGFLVDSQLIHDSGIQGSIENEGFCDFLYERLNESDVKE